MPRQTGGEPVDSPRVAAQEILVVHNLSTRLLARNARAVGSVMLGAACLVASLGGCGATSREYRAQVRNGAGQLVRAQIILEPTLSDDVTLDTIDLRPGESGGLGPVIVSKTGRVRLSVGRPGEIGLPPTEIRLSPGSGVFDVDDSSNFGVTGLTISRAGGLDTDR